ncbi:MAG: BatA domain-containing protein [Aureliella sp.]
MGFLTPLYALAALAIAGPIVFHLIQRQPKGMQEFSSHMFLSSSKPQLTRRSRLDNWPLLLLRALVLLLLALAFTRPYWREASLATSTVDGQTVAIVLDTSGSMRQPGLWEAAIAESRSVLADLAPSDRVGLFTVDSDTKTIVPFQSDSEADGLQTQTDVRSQLDSLEPSYAGSELGRGLVIVADRLHARSFESGTDQAEKSTITLISDLHQRSGVDSLQGFEWPESVQLDVRQVAASEPGNAYMSVVAPSDDEDETIRIRVNNTSSASQSVFTVNWMAPTGDTVSGTRLQVPPGQSRVVSLGQQPIGATALELVGDSFTDDNRIYFAQRKQIQLDVLFAGEQQLPDEQRLDYFLRKLPLATAAVQRVVRSVPHADLPTLLSSETTSAAVVEVTDDSLPIAESIRKFADQGGTVILCLPRKIAGSERSIASSLSALLDLPGISVLEANTAEDEFELLSSVDYRHRVFAPFADPRYNDFSKLRFWAHRSVKLPEADSSKVIAKLDGGDPLLVEQRVGDGTIWVVTTGWQPKASGLGTSSKFVPIMLGLLERTTKRPELKSRYYVGETIAVEGETRVRLADGAAAPEQVYKSDDDGVEFLVPGKYSLQASVAGEQVIQEVAISMPSTESLTEPLDTEVFEQFGVRDQPLESEEERIESQAQLKVEQLEKKQRLWQWLLACGGAVLAIESIVGVFSRRDSADS